MMAVKVNVVVEGWPSRMLGKAPAENKLDVLLYARRLMLKILQFSSISSRSEISHAILDFSSTFYFYGWWNWSKVEKVMPPSFKVDVYVPSAFPLTLASCDIGCSKQILEYFTTDIVRLIWVTPECIYVCRCNRQIVVDFVVQWGFAGFKIVSEVHTSHVSRGPLTTSTSACSVKSIAVVMALVSVECFVCVTMATAVITVPRTQPNHTSSKKILKASCTLTVTALFYLWLFWTLKNWTRLHDESSMYCHNRLDAGEYLHPDWTILLLYRFRYHDIYARVIWRKEYTCLLQVESGTFPPNIIKIGQHLT